MRRHAALLTVLAGAALVAVPARPASAAPCPSTGGVTVVVDFASLGGGTSRQCAPGDPASGLAALRGAGFTPTRAAQEPGYFLCRINGKPANDPCQRTSPANAYWSYWHARPGGSWTYSSIGPADYDPAPGSVEGWAFGAGKPPSSAPPRASTPTAPASTTTSSSRPSPSPTPAPVARPSAAAMPRVRPAVTRSAAAAVTTAPSPATSSQDPSPSPSADGSAGRIGYAIEVPHSSLAGPLLAAVVVALLLAGAASAVVRRRREDRS